MMKLRMDRFVDSPAGSIGVVVIVVFVSELLIMLLVEDLFHPPFRPSVSALFWYFIDPVLVSALAGLTLYFTILRPMKKEQAKFKSILDTLSEGVALNEVVMDAGGEMIDYRILEVNPAFHSTADFVQDGAVEGQLATRLYGMNPETIRAFWSAHRNSVVEMESEMVSPISGRYFSVRTSPFFRGKFVTSFRDITERKRGEVALYESEGRLRQLYASLQTAREEERRRLARELHDDLGQRVTALRMDLDWVESRLPVTTPLLPAKMANVSVQIDDLTDSIRRLIEDMRPGMLDVLGLVAAVEDYVDKFVARTGIGCELITGGDEIKVNDEIGIGIFRIVQEALNNVQKYAQATRASVRLQQSSDQITLTVEDNGVGLPKTTDEGLAGFGVRGMNERVAIMGGRFSITSPPDHGVRIEAVIPT